MLADTLGLVTSRPKASKLLLAVHLRDLLQEQVQGAEDCLLVAAVQGPMYGTVAVLRSVLEEVKEGERGAEWADLIADILSVCYRAWRAVREVVASDSPEGHLPMDQEAVRRAARGGLGGGGKEGDRRSIKGQLHTAGSRLEVKDVFPVELVEEVVDELVCGVLGQEVRRQPQEMGEKVWQLQVEKVGKQEEPEEGEEVTEAGHTKAKEVSSQMLLLCAWRTVKEVSLLLGHLCSTFSSKENATNLVTVDQVLQVSDFLMNLLLETKHRGAFEQAYVAFCSLVSCLWRSSLPALHSQPALLMEQVLPYPASKILALL